MTSSPESNANSSADALPARHGNAAEDFVRSIAYSAVQEPISGLTQIADGLLNTNLLPKVQFIAKAEAAPFGSLDWHAQQVGSAVGMLLPFMLVGKGSKSLIGGEAAAEAGLLSRTSMIGLSVKQAALSGFAYDAFLRPSDYQKGDRLSFLESRGLNGVTGAASFTALSLSGIGLNSLAESAAVKNTFMAPVLRSNIAAGIISGIPAGTVSAELSAWRQGKAVPSLTDLGQTVYGYSMVGGLLGAAHTVKSDPNLRIDNLTTKVQNRLSELKSSAQSATVNLSNALFPEHELAFNGMRPAFAGATFSAGLDRTEPIKMVGNRIPGGGQAGRPDTVREQTDHFKELERVINRGQDHQDYIQKLLSDRLTALQRQGKVGMEWDVYPTKAGSPADQIGADYILVNTRNGEFHLLDATSNTEKIENPDKHNVPLIRREGLIYYEKPWFDQMGSLRVDAEEPQHIRNAVADFQQDIVSQLTSLTQKSSPLKLGEVEFPDILPTEKGQDQVGKFIASLKAAAVKSDGNDRFLLNDFAQKLEKSTATHLDKTARSVDSPPLRDRIAKVADKVILNTAVDRLLRRDSTPTRNTDPKSDIRFHGKTNSINLEEDGVIYNSGDMAEALRQSRGRMLNKDNITAGLSKGQWKALRDGMPGQNDSRITEQLASRITSMANEMSNGGAVGAGRPVLIDEIVQRLKGSTPDNLLGRQQPAQPEEKPAQKPPEIEKPPISRAMLSEFVDVWKEAGFAKPGPNENIDTAVQLVFEELMGRKPDPQPYQTMLNNYLAGDAATARALWTAFYTS